MAVAFAKLRFIRVRGRIVPLRGKTLGRRAPKEVNKAVDKVLKDLKKAKKSKSYRGSGIDFHVFGPLSTKMGALALKVPRGAKYRSKLPKTLKKRYPGIEDPAVRSKTLGESLPNYTVPTVESQTIVFPKGKKGLLQEFQNFDSAKKIKARGIHGEIPASFRDQSFLRRETDRLSKETGLDFDPNLGNIAPGGYLADTALGRLPRVKDFYSRTTRELFEDIAQNKRSSDFVSDAAIEAGTSRKAVKQINKLLKKGYRFKPSKGFSGEYDLLSPAQRINRAKGAGIKFDKKGRPIRPKK